MAYFVTIQTSGKITQMDSILRMHGEKLGNYVKFGESLTNEGYALYRNRNEDPKNKKVISANTVSQNDGNFNFAVATYLCCEDDVDNDGK